LLKYSLHESRMKTIFVIFILLLNDSARSQELLANGGFEDENICTEYHINCAPEAWICTSPSYSFYFKEAKLAHSGGHFMGILAGHSKSTYKRTFIRSRLVCSLQKDHRYRLSFFIKSRHDITDSAGIYFTAYDFLLEKNVFHKIIPTVYLADALQKPVKTDTGWQQVVINYTATGQENFLSIGYFGKNDLKGSTGIPMENNFLFFVDDLSMIPQDPAEMLCPGWRANIDTIYAQNERHEYLDMFIRYYRNDPPPVHRFPSTIAPHIDTLIIPDILFASGSAVLNKSSYPLLDSFCTAINKRSFDSLCVTGHTDSIGTLDYNNRLSAGRAQAVADYIKQQLMVRDDNLRIRYYAWFKPIALNSTAAGRQKNRRVEILLYRHN
jgi:outer membrane protein OmpA-like peptidoglycan-associated protein